MTGGSFPYLTLLGLCPKPHRYGLLLHKAFPHGLR